MMARILHANRHSIFLLGAVDARHTRQSLPRHTVIHYAGHPTTELPHCRCCFCATVQNGCMLSGVGAHREARKMGGPGFGHAGKALSFAGERTVCLFCLFRPFGMASKIKFACVGCNSASLTHADFFRRSAALQVCAIRLSTSLCGKRIC